MSGAQSDIFLLFSFEIFAESNFSCTFAIPKGKFTDNWCGSSVGLEYRPVTPGVASSSLVRTAERRFDHPVRSPFLFCARLERAAPAPRGGSRLWRRGVTWIARNARACASSSLVRTAERRFDHPVRSPLLFCAPRCHSAKQPHMDPHQKPLEGPFLCARGRYRQVAHRSPSHTAQNRLPVAANWRNPCPQPENREASPPLPQGPRWHIDMLRATILVGKASGCASQMRQGHMRMLCEFRVWVSCSAPSGYSARQEQKATIRPIGHSFCQVCLSF